MEQNPKWMAPYLAAVSAGATLSEACKEAGVNNSTVHRRRGTDPDFNQQVIDAFEASADILEAAARRRAVDGVEKGVWHQGVQVGTETVYSDALLTLLLKGRRKHVFADRTEITGADGGPVATADATQRATRTAMLLKLAQARKAMQEIDIDDLV